MLMETLPEPRIVSIHESASEELAQQICALTDEIRCLRERLKPVSHDELTAAHEETPHPANISPTVTFLYETTGRVRALRETVRLIESSLDI